jgi:peptidoglycan/xylan/chitin deacetylase (PgdA/CDA1 family)
VKVTAAAADGLRPRQPGVTILIYHRVGRRTAVEVDLPVSLFDDQMAALAAGGGVLTLDAALDRLTGHPSTPDAAGTVVTFDDGTADFAEVALPILAHHRVTALLYLATDFVERGRSFPDDGRPLSWSALADALTTGVVAIGSHTHTHALLDRVDRATAAAELDRSVGLIEDRLGVVPIHFAYPKAVLGTPAAEEEVRRRFRSAAVAGTRPNVVGRTDVHRLARSPVQVADGMRWWRRKVAGGMRLEDDVRRWLNRRRYAGATG